MRIKQLPASLRATGIAFLIVLGLVLYHFRVGSWFERLSYDLPFMFRSRVSTKDVVLVYLDDGSARALHQSVSEPWDRALHVRLLDRMTRDGVKLVYYDIVFAGPGRDPAVDQQFADAIRRNGHVILGGDFQAMIEQGVYRESAIRPFDLFQDAAAGWGLVIFRPIDPDYAVRQLYCGDENAPTASWAAAWLLHAPVAADPQRRLEHRWMNYYGPAGSFASASFNQALQEDGVPPDFFRDKIVLVGRRTSTGGIISERDDFATPYSRWGNLFTPGIEVHATELLNLVRHDWIERIDPRIEILAICLGGLAIGIVANFLSPLAGAGLLAIFEFLIVGTAFALVWHARIWFDWAIPALVQIPIALVWSSGSQYFLEARKRAALRDAFSLYLSPHMADRIANSDFDLKPGGKLVEATVVFTDCKGFTAMSEELKDPVKISETLIAYFTQTSQCVLDNDGTIIKYIGDAVMAAWGAPIDEKDHPYKAALAAWQMREASKIVVMGRVLATRVGVCTGPVLAGNLGSPYRFDYTLIGDTTNFASRLEGLNKFVNTSILISDSTQKHLGDRFLTRLVGYFALAGKAHGVPVHELVCPASDSSGAGQQWIGIFAEAMEAIKTGAFEPAKGLFRKTVWERGGEDGPSEFYLKKIAQLEKENALQEWTGVIRLDEK